MRIDVSTEVNALANHLRLCIQARRLPMTAVERELGMGVGYLGQLLRGNLDLKVKHLLAVLRVIGMEPEEFFASLYSDSLPLRHLRRPAASLPHPGGPPAAAGGSAPDAGGRQPALGVGGRKR